MCAASGESEAHVAGMQVAHARAIIAEVRVNAIGIQQTMGDQLEHEGLAGWWERLDARALSKDRTTEHPFARSGSDP